MAKQENPLDLAIREIEKKYGKGTVMAGSMDEVEPVAVIPTGSIVIDSILGIGGLPKGRIAEIYGPEASGKSTICLHLLAECQKAGGTAAIVDTEHALDLEYAERIGVDLGSLIISQPDFGEQALDVVLSLIRAGTGMVVLDSVAALVPEKEFTDDMTEDHVGLHARLLSKFFRKAVGVIHKSDAVLVLTNQIRSKIQKFGLGDGQTTFGGWSVKYNASVRMKVARITNIIYREQPIGIQSRVEIVKSRVAPPYRSGVIDIVFGKGISDSGSIIDLGEQYGIIGKSGSWYSYGDKRLGQGKEAVRQLLDSEPGLCQELREKIRLVIRGGEPWK